VCVCVTFAGERQQKETHHVFKDQSVSEQRC